MLAVPPLLRRTAIDVSDIDSILLISRLVETPALRKEWIPSKAWVSSPLSSSL